MRVELLCLFKVLVQFVDYGDSEEVTVESLRSLPDDSLVALPPQVGDLAVTHCFCESCKLCCFVTIFHCVFFLNIRFWYLRCCGCS